MSDLTYVTYCGLYCKLCDTYSRIPQQASALRKTLLKGGFEYFGSYVMDGFKEFWAGLEQLGKVDSSFNGCRGGCGDPGCNIRKCAQEHNVELYSSCNDYPCNYFDVLAKRYPNLIADGNVNKW